MKEGLTGKKRDRGLATIEILMAFVVFTLAMTAVMMVVFGGQSFAIDTKLTQRALYHAERGIEHAYASSTASLDSLVAGTTTIKFSSLGLVGDDAVYGEGIELIVPDPPISDCAKKAISRVSWKQEQRTRFVQLASVFTSIANSEAMGGDCATEEIVDDWINPEVSNTNNLQFKATTDVSIVKNSVGRLAVLTSQRIKMGPNEGSVWIVNTTDPKTPNIVDVYDTNSDMFAVKAVNIDGKSYAFAVGATSTTQGQLRVFDVSGGMLNLLTQHDLDGVFGSFPAGVSVNYYDKHVYVGTKETGGPELHVFDVSGLPGSIEHKGSFPVNRNVNDIVVRDSLAYLATGPGTAGPPEPFMVYDVSDPGNINLVSMFEASGQLAGTAVFILEDRAYLGRQGATGSDKDFFIIDISDSANPTELGSLKLEIKNNDVKGVEVVGHLAFIATDDQEPSTGGATFMVYDVGDPENIILVSTCGINFSEKTTGLDFVDNLAFMSKDTPAGQGGLIIVEPGDSCG